MLYMLMGRTYTLWVFPLRVFLLHVLPLLALPRFRVAGEGPQQTPLVPTAAFINGTPLVVDDFEDLVAGPNVAIVHVLDPRTRIAFVLLIPILQIIKVESQRNIWLFLVVCIDVRLGYV